MQTNTIKSRKESSKLVQEFFNDHAPSYKAKYQDKDIFYDYFFYERLEKATRGIDFESKTVLDIGAGTGPLFDYLNDNGLATYSRYDATDISEGMLNQSNIPKGSKFIGEFLELSLPSYDLIFMLGVSTYLSLEQMRDHIRKVTNHLNPEGQFIVTFTHRKSLDIGMRKLLKPIAGLFSGRDKIINQDFMTKYYSKSEIDQLFQGYRFTVLGLNHTIFPFSRMFKRPSVLLAKLFSKRKESRIKHFLSSDLLVKVILK